MKQLLLILCFVGIVSITKAQTQYTVNKVAYGTVNSNGQVHAGSFKQLSKTFIAYLYSNSLVFDEGYDGKGDTYYKFVRVINTDDPNKHKWNALDRYGKACEITVKDYNNYTLIAIKPMDSSNITIYQTL